MIGDLINKFVGSVLGPERMERFERYLDETLGGLPEEYENPNDPKRTPEDRERIVLKSFLGALSYFPHDRDNQQDVEWAVSRLMALPTAFHGIPGLKKGERYVSPVTGQPLDTQRVMQVLGGMETPQRHKILPHFSAQEVRDFREELARQEVTYGDDRARQAILAKMWRDFDKEIEIELYGETYLIRGNDPYFFETLEAFTDIRDRYKEYRLFSPDSVLVPDEQSWKKYKDLYKQVLHQKISSHYYDDDDPSGPGGGLKFGFQGI